MNEEGQITFANKSLLEMSSYSLEEIKELNFNDLIHPHISKDEINKTWEFLREGKIWSGNTKLITKNKEAFYLKNTVFKVNINSIDEYITIGFSTTKENNEKREFHKKVLMNVQEFNKKEYAYKKEIAELTDQHLEYKLQDAGIIRHIGKLKAIRDNAIAWQNMQTQGIDMVQWLWDFVGNTTIINDVPDYKQAPTQTETSQKLSKALKKNGFKFVGPTTCYAFMQAIGMVNDHENECMSR